MRALATVSSECQDHIVVWELDVDSEHGKAFQYSLLERTVNILTRFHFPERP